MSPFLVAALFAAQPCAKCHRDIAATQAQSNMALTWQAVSAPAMSKSEGSIEYKADGGLYHVAMPGREDLAMPVEAMVGGKRHGRSFLVRLKAIEDVPLARAPLIETRYLERRGALVLSPGFPEDQPVSYETALGRVLSPSFEKKCLTCHGSPQYTPEGRPGIQCENCHGPGQPHLVSIAKGRPGGIVNPGKSSNAKILEFCGQCHSGFSDLVDPLPQDLLISNQVTALRNSECYIQSGQGLSCLSCHNPHENARHDDPKVIRTCLGCHGAQAKGSPCPVNPKGNCVSCHMPVEQRGSFALVDHWIRVHPEKGSAPARPVARSHVPPKHLFLKIIAVRGRAEAGSIREQLVTGASFFDLAREHSIDPSASAGGFLGEMWPDKMDPALAAAAARLAPGAISDVLESRGNFLILQRLPRDFRWQAIALEEEASALKAKGRLDEAIDKYTEALRINPVLLRALIFLGAGVGEKREKDRAVAILEQATLLYPNDPSAHYNLGIAYGAAGRISDEMESYRRALELEPGLVPAWLNLGAALLSAGRNAEAAAVFERALQVNPLSATLYYNLGLAQQAEGKPEEAARAFALAAKIDPRFAKLRASSRSRLGN